MKKVELDEQARGYSMNNLTQKQLETIKTLIEGHLVNLKFKIKVRGIKGWTIELEEELKAAHALARTINELKENQKDGE